MRAVRVVDAHHHVWNLGVRDQDWIAGPALAPLRSPRHAILLLDLLATGDRDAVTGAFERFVRLYETADPDASTR